MLNTIKGAAALGQDTSENGDGLAMPHNQPATRIATAPTIPSFDALPDGAFIREAQLVQSPKHPDRPAPLPFSAPTLWRKVKNGTFPKPVKLSERVTAWKVGDIRAWAAAQAMA